MSKTDAPALMIARTQMEQLCGNQAHQRQSLSIFTAS
jgi:hypothetical protein